MDAGELPFPVDVTAAPKLMHRRVFLGLVLRSKRQRVQVVHKAHYGFNLETGLCENSSRLASFGSDEMSNNVQSKKKKRQAVASYTKLAGFPRFNASGCHYGTNSQLKWARWYYEVAK
ncbi:hypothetical protein K1719_020559 [Acacia pycnantha]|nr:hypothetical protein K1719_020559 [Acacia pycnantha]